MRRWPIRAGGGDGIRPRMTETLRFCGVVLHTNPSTHTFLRMTAPKTTRQMHPGCRLTADGKVDGRTKEAALMRRVRAGLIAHVGGRPSASQSVLIDRAVSLSLQLARLDIDLAAGMPIDQERFLAWSNSLSRIMTRLGPAKKPPVPSLADISERIVRNRGAAEAAA